MEVNTEDLSVKPVIDVDCCIFPLAVVECIEEMYSYHRKNEGYFRLFTFCLGDILVFWLCKGIFPKTLEYSLSALDLSLRLPHSLFSSSSSKDKYLNYFLFDVRKFFFFGLPLSVYAISVRTGLE
ncbi:hypothetical protein IFM89_014069 [Coptis chinensis]|uniref:Uncharacterized protein n=1 Tax=Coptis chinensis TaxID=261450 RepID=A0A835HME9_9MAGN|nr:hypothetical protein IFM89_014069 [Coptis chinensis]